MRRGAYGTTLRPGIGLTEAAILRSELDAIARAVVTLWRIASEDDKVLDPTTLVVERDMLGLHVSMTPLEGGRLQSLSHSARKSALGSLR